MIQRIQSVYLLVVTILIIICLCSPVGSYIGSDYSVSALTNLCLTMADGTKDYAPWALFCDFAGCCGSCFRHYLLV